MSKVLKEASITISQMMALLNKVWIDKLSLCLKVEIDPICRCKQTCHYCASIYMEVNDL